ncbi:MAG: hypothetical protein RLY71_3784 [Pseudomonadota bacterium]|jgi:hypothetical protein
MKTTLHPARRLFRVRSRAQLQRQPADRLAVCLLLSLLLNAVLVLQLAMIGGAV